jgi:uncharacterized membrane protein
MGAETTEEGSVGPRRAPGDQWRRGEEPEFTRLATFTDGIYAIALTLLVLGIRVDNLRQPDSSAAMWSALNDLLPDLIAFVVAFVLLADYWMAHHDFYASLAAIDRPLIAINLAYLIFVAFLPFPTSLVGEYEENPVSVLIFAAVLAAISGMEVLMYVQAHKGRLMRTGLSPSEFRWGLLASAPPVIVFLVTVPFAYVSTTGVMISWGVLIPLLTSFIRRRAPEHVRATNRSLARRRR